MKLRSSSCHQTNLFPLTCKFGIFRCILMLITVKKINGCMEEIHEGIENAFKEIRSRSVYIFKEY